jgi:hypothetical protein
MVVKRLYHFTSGNSLKLTNNFNQCCSLFLSFLTQTLNKLSDRYIEITDDRLAKTGKHVIKHLA